MESSFVNANPTKSFFISMLVKDITLIDAIADLVDNSIDGAIKVKGDQKDYSGLYVHLSLNKDGFSIVDNCGGFSAEVAAEYAFRFGRPEKAKNEVSKSIGRFGVGMKRALFKIGEFISVTSICEESEFTIEIDVNEWKKDVGNDWQFAFKEILDEPSKSEFGTSIKVTNIHKDVSEQFDNRVFIDMLKKELKSSHEKMLERGLKIVINDDELEFEPSTFLISESIKPAYKHVELPNGVKVDIYAGISEKGKPKKAGWYIYCNDRRIVEANQTMLTGWSDGLPMFHNRFARFRGYVFFNSPDTTLLPWNTTKSGIDQDSLIFRGIRLEMIKMSSPVISFLNDLIKENVEDDNEEDLTDVSLNDQVNNAKIENISNLKIEGLTTRFQGPRLKRVKKPTDNQKIQYSKPVSEIEQVKELLKVDTLKEVGEKTFEYFYNLEVED